MSKDTRENYRRLADGTLEWVPPIPPPDESVTLSREEAERVLAVLRTPAWELLPGEWAAAIKSLEEKLG